MSHPDNVSLSVVTIARDEEERIGRALGSVAWAGERLVVDSGSSDRTVQVARDRGATVVETEGWPGYGVQKRRAIRRAAHPWVLVLDADEVVSDELGRAIRRALTSPPPEGVDGYELRFLTRALGHWFGRRGWHREWHLRLVRKEAVEVSGERVHESLRVPGEVRRLEGAVLHYTNRSVAHHVEKMQRYSGVKAEEMHAEGKETGLAGAVGHAASRFLSGYLLRGRFLDGWAGLVNEILGAVNNLLAYLKLWERGRGAERSAGRGAGSVGREEGGARPRERSAGPRPEGETERGEAPAG